jgi:hypothetical protein
MRWRSPRCYRGGASGLAARLQPEGANALALFRANRFAGLLMFAACVVVGAS